MEKEENPIYERNTLEFVTVALEYCTFVEAARNTGLFDFVDKATKLLLYTTGTIDADYVDDDEDYGYDLEFEDDDVDGSVDEDDNEPV